MVNLQYLTDNIGNRNAVILSMADWYNIQKSLEKIEELQIYKEKNQFFEKLQIAFEESKLHSEGKIQLQNAKDFLYEL